MAVLAIVSSSPPSAEGGHLVVARALVDTARAAGHDAHLVMTPDYGFGRQTSGYIANWRTDVSRVGGRTVDQVISLRYPSYAVRHPAHVHWMSHTMREYYDLWPRLTASISFPNLVKETARKIAIHAVDNWLLTRHVTRVVAMSETIQKRLVRDFALQADVVHPPPPPRRYRCDDYGDYIFAVSRLTPLKRVDLLVRALAEAAASHVRAVIAGEGEQQPELEQLARDLGVADRITFAGRIDDDALVEHLARCRAVCFTPFAEDYGFVTVEAFASRKAVVTCADSGGPAELVTDEETGVVCEPAPASIAIALARLMDDRHFAERLGANAGPRAAGMSWDAALRRLLLV
jgi:glycosyltransferase involved in cell wall biosynthesis